MSTGGEGKHLLAGGHVRVNGAVELRRGRQLRDGDRIDIGAEGAQAVSTRQRTERFVVRYDP